MFKNIFKKKYIFIFLFFLFFCFSLFSLPLLTKAQKNSPDVIAIRVFPNSEHYSSLQWFRKQNFKGSPQVLIVDGYDAIRDGKTIYVNAANIDLDNDNFYTNIYLISYNQEAENDTKDIFGKILQHWKFNINLSNTGICHNESSVICYTNKDCPNGDYCLSQKAKVVRDTRRLSDLVYLREMLNSYRDNSQFKQFPSLKSGTYIPGKTISVWPSWQRIFAKTIGLDKIPVDPINKMGECCPLSNAYCNSSYNYNKITCWDEEHKDFSGDIPENMPSETRIYAYNFSDDSSDVCAQLETNYVNIQSFRCFIDTSLNRSPQITGVNLRTRPKEEFRGFLKGIDPDGDELHWTISLVSPSNGNVWVNNHGWQWDFGFNNFSLFSENNLNQIMVHASKSGLANVENFFRVRISLDDGRGEANSVISKEYSILIQPYPLTLSKTTESIVIGQDWLYTLNGTDSNKDPFSSINFLDGLLSRFDNSEININNISELTNHGFSIGGMDISESLTLGQRTGKYTLNIQAQDLLTGGTIQSPIDLEISNHPPIIDSININYVNSTNENCDLSTPCSYVIDNGEPASVNINAHDDDFGHTLVYSLIDDFGGLISINSNGLISGLENLNYGGASEQTFNIRFRVSDQYCSYSLPNECGVNANFNLSVMPFCSVSDLSSSQNFNISGPTTINSGAGNIAIGNVLSNCSESDVRMEIALNGRAESKAIVFVLDTSYSMEALIDGEPAIDLMKNVMANNANNILDRLYSIASNLPNSYHVYVGLVSFNKNIEAYPATSTGGLVNISDAGELTALKSEINSYVTDFETNTLEALNEAEKKLNTISDPSVEKNIILLSDGEPIIMQNLAVQDCYDDTCGCDRMCPSNSDVGGVCLPLSSSCCNFGRSYCYNQAKCCDDDRGVGGVSWYACCPKQCYQGWDDRICPINPLLPSIWPDNCTSTIPFDDSLCPCGVRDRCNNPHCKTNCGLGLNDKADFKIAVTAQTQCLSGQSGTCTSSDDCDTSICQRCYTTTGHHGACNIKDDVDTEAQAIKNKGINIYSIYYDTGSSNKDINIMNMCVWSSDDICSSCPNDPCGGSYAFFGDDIDILFDNFLREVLMKPNTISVNGMPVDDIFPFSINTPSRVISLNPILQCGTASQSLNFSFSGEGSLEIKNININYCPSKLHLIGSCLDNDGDGYGVCPNCNIDHGCLHDGDDCDDSLLGADGLAGTIDDGANINPAQPDDCSQYDNIDNNCNNEIDEHADTSNVLTNVNFENGPVGGFPVNWDGDSQDFSSVGISQDEAMSGLQSVLIKQEANLEYPGVCAKTLCDILLTCTWQVSPPECQFSSAASQNNYNEGEILTWPNTNRIMRAALTYNVSALSFNVGDTYIEKFYYKGNAQFNNTMKSYFAYNLSWFSQLWKISDYPGWTCGPPQFVYGNLCSDINYCCLHANSLANQKKAYSYIPLASIPDNNYSNWILHSNIFTYTSDMLNVLDDDGNIMHTIGIKVGNNSTGSQGSNIYIDDFQLLKCINK